MAFVTEARARAASAGATTRMAKSMLASAAAAQPSAQFDVFLSHSYLDAELVLGVKRLLEATGLSVYVDWIDDQQMDRAAVTATTAHRLRMRMRSSKSLIFVTSATSSTSKWMPWELGYFDGFRPDHVAILPLVQTQGGQFSGQEYLGLYPLVEDVNFLDATSALAIRTSPTRATRISSFPTLGAKRP